MLNRNEILFKNISAGLFYKILNLGIVYLSIPILLNYLDKEEYGLWVTIFSIINIVFFVDFGIANGLKTKLTKALTNNNRLLAKEYITSAYISIFGIAIVILIIGAIFIYNINLQSLLNTSIPDNELKKVFLVTLLMIVTGFVLNLYKVFYYAVHKSSKVELSLLIYQIVILLLLIIALTYLSRSLLYVALFYGLSNIIVSVFFTYIFFKKEHDILPSYKFFSREKVNDLMGLSLSFFVIQLCMIVIFTSDNILISNLLGPKEVTSYDIVFKLFQVVITLFVIAQDPFWPLYAEAYQKKDFNWIKSILLKLNRYFLLLFILIIGLILTAQTIISIWIPKNLNISWQLIIFMGIFVLIRTYGIMYMNFLNGVGKVKIQMWLYVLGALINIPLSIYFVKVLNLGSSGVILGTIISIISMSIILPIQTFNILKDKNKIQS